MPTLDQAISHLRYIPDYPFADEFQYLIITPVEPPEYYPFSNCPYGADAPDRGISNDTKTYEIPCYARSGINAGLNRSYKDWQGGTLPRPSIPAGLRSTIVAYSNQPQNGSIPGYCNGVYVSSPECSDPACRDVFESIWRYYKGHTAVTHLDYPARKEWWVEYENVVVGWFTQDTFWIRQANGASYQGPWRFNCWYKGVVRAQWNGDAANDYGYRNWIASQDSGFGVEYRPKFTACNDVLIQCAHQERGMAVGCTNPPDCIYPHGAAQDTVEYQGEHTPCIRSGKGYSRWFLPYGDCSSPGGNRPDCGLYHQITRKKFTQPDFSISSEEGGWAKLYFSTSTPRFVIAD